MMIIRIIRLVLVASLTLSTGFAQTSGGILSSLKIYGGIGIHEMGTAEHFMTVFSDNGFASSKTMPHPIYGEETRTYPYHGRLAKENVFIQLELELGLPFVAGAGIQGDKYGTIFGRTPADEFVTLDYLIRSRYIYGGLVQPLGRAFTFRGGAGFSMNDINLKLDTPLVLTGAPTGWILMGGIDYTLSQLVSIGFMARHNAVADWKVTDIEWTFHGNQLSLVSNDMPTAQTDINFTLRLSIF